MVQTETNRRRYKNAQRDLKVTFTLHKEDNSYHYAEVRGEAVERVMGKEARDHIDELSQKYHG